MPSRSKIFSLPNRLRSRSRSVARNNNNNNNTKGHQHQRLEVDVESASAGRRRRARSSTTTTSATASAAAVRSKSPQSVASPSSSARTGNNSVRSRKAAASIASTASHEIPNGYTNKSPTATASPKTLSTAAGGGNGGNGGVGVVSYTLSSGTASTSSPVTPLTPTSVTSANNKGDHHANSSNDIGMNHHTSSNGAHHYHQAHQHPQQQQQYEFAPQSQDIFTSSIQSGYTRQNTNDSQTSATSNEEDNAEFTSAFTRSPPSFDKFDSDVLGEHGVFPQDSLLLTNSDSAAGEGGGSYRYSLSAEGSEEPTRSVGPHGIQWHNGVGNSQSQEEQYGGDEGSSSFMAYSQEESLDPPAILMLDDDEDDEEYVVERGGNSNRNNDGLDVNNGHHHHYSVAPQSQQVVKDDKNNNNNVESSSWFDHASFETTTGPNKNRRLVSPSPSPAKTLTASQPTTHYEHPQFEANTSKDDDLAAWGGIPVAQSSNNLNAASGFDDNVFGTDFFSGFNNSDGDDGFGTTSANDDAFGFGNSWMNVNASSASNSSDGAKKQTSKHMSSEQMDQQQHSQLQLQQGESDPWAESSSSFVSPSFNYSLSNEDSSSVVVKRSPVSSMEENKSYMGENGQEKKNDPPEAGRNKNDPPESRAGAPPATMVWDGAAGRGGNGAAPPHHPLKQQPQQQQLHPLKQPQSSRGQDNEVVVTFDGGLSRPGPPIDHKQQHRKVPSHPKNVNGISIPHNRPGGAPATTAQQHRHRRLNSNGSQSSRRSQLSHQQQQQQRRTKKSGGSVGSNRSNSSAVDQILEHYRNKRRGNLGGVGASSSVHSGSQFSSKDGSSPGSTNNSGPTGTTTGTTTGTAIRNGGNGGVIVRSGSGSSGQAQGAPAGVGYHHRNPSNESVSRIIDNLESTAANRSKVFNNATVAQQHRTPNPMVAKHYPPSIMGIVPTAAGDISGDDAASDRFLMANIEATIGPRGVAPDMESLSGRSSVRSHRSHSRGRRSSAGGGQQPQQQQQQHPSSSRPQRSPSRSYGRSGSGSHRRDRSVDSRASRASRASRNSFRTYQSTRSALSYMSKETQSVANDLFRLEAQLAEQVARQQRGEEDQEENGGGNAAASAAPGVLSTVNGSSSLENITYSTSGELGTTSNNQNLGATPVPRSPAPFQIVAPPGKLGILLSNSKSSSSNNGSNGTSSASHGPTHISAVRSESVLAGKVHVGDIFVSIDGEDVTRMNSKEITNIMARKAEFERVIKFRPLVSNVTMRQEWI